MLFIRTVTFEGQTPCFLFALLLLTIKHQAYYFLCAVVKNQEVTFICPVTSHNCVPIMINRPI